MFLLFDFHPIELRRAPGLNHVVDNHEVLNNGPTHSQLRTVVQVNHLLKIIIIPLWFSETDHALHDVPGTVHIGV